VKEGARDGKGAREKGVKRKEGEEGREVEFPPL